MSFHNRFCASLLMDVVILNFFFEGGEIGDFKILGCVDTPLLPPLDFYVRVEF